MPTDGAPEIAGITDDERGRTPLVGGAKAWALDYAPHISFYGRPLFLHSAGSADPVEQIAYVAALGFAGIQDPIAAIRPIKEQERIGQAIADHGLRNGCFSFRVPDLPDRPMWSHATADIRAHLAHGLRDAIEVGHRIGSRHISVTSVADPSQPKWLQLARMAENLRLLADDAATADMTIVLESLNYRRVPNMLMTHLGDAYVVAKMAAHPAVRLIFDTGHVQAMDGALAENLADAWDLIEVVQLADNPGRLEPGVGEINFERFLSELIKRRFTGLCELEHLWSRNDRLTEELGVARLRLLDQNAAALAAVSSP